MSYPSKQKELYEAVCAELTKYGPGTKLPPEREFASRLGVARETLRSALGRLETEQRIVRNNRGTFIRSSTFRNRSSRPVTLLLPCPDYQLRADRSSVYEHQQMLLGAMRTAIRHDTHAVTIPVSETNDPGDINLTQLRSLQENSVVLFSGDWFRNVAAILADRHCRIGAITGSPDRLPPLSGTVSFVCSTSTMFRDATAGAAEELISDGARSLLYFGIDYAWISLSREGRKRFLQTLKRHGLDCSEDRFATYPAGLTIPEIFQRIRKLYRRFRFDGLILELPPEEQQSINEDFFAGTGLPLSVRIVTCGSVLLRQRTFAERAKVLHVPYMRIASEMVDHLLSYSAESIVREGKFIIQPSAEFIEETRFQ